ncbi:hypothetical protein QA811_17825 [Streptomyces sp. B21-102]|uniref:hypothetical protein n=1 Tax=Streptomyces sp. B21-102 TaxID=3039416 RepID=UPI002FF20E55
MSVLLGIALTALALDMIVVAIVAASGELSSVPWLPKDDSDEAIFAVCVGSFLLLIVTRTLVRSAYLRGRGGHLPPQPKRAWRYREMSRREKRRLGMAILFSSAILSVPLALSEQLGGTGSPAFTVVISAGTLGMISGVAMVLVHVRPSRTVMQIVEARVEDERRQMARDLSYMRESDARHMERWKEETVERLYAMVMEQVDRGVISCSKCVDNDSAQQAAPEEASVPLSHRPGSPNEACECGGPSSIPVIYFPPRFQPKRTAS